MKCFVARPFVMRLVSFSFGLLSLVDLGQRPTLNGGAEIVGVRSGALVSMVTGASDPQKSREPRDHDGACIFRTVLLIALENWPRSGSNWPSSRGWTHFSAGLIESGYIVKLAVGHERLDCTLCNQKFQCNGG